MYKVLHSVAPSYLNEKKIIHYHPTRVLHSQIAGILVVPRVSESSVCGGVSSCLAQVCWNSSQSGSLSQTLFKTRQKQSSLLKRLQLRWTQKCPQYATIDLGLLSTCAFPSFPASPTLTNYLSIHNVHFTAGAYAFLSSSVFTFFASIHLQGSSF